MEATEFYDDFLAVEIHKLGSSRSPKAAAQLVETFFRFDASTSDLIEPSDYQHMLDAEQDLADNIDTKQRTLDILNGLQSQLAKSYARKHGMVATDSQIEDSFRNVRIEEFDTEHCLALSS